MAKTPPFPPPSPPKKGKEKKRKENNKTIEVVNFDAIHAGGQVSSFLSSLTLPQKFDFYIRTRAIISVSTPLFN